MSAIWPSFFGRPVSVLRLDDMICLPIPACIHALSSTWPLWIATTIMTAPIKTHVVLESDLGLCAVVRPLDATRYSVLVESSINSLTAAEILAQLRNEGVQDLYEQPRSGNHGKIFLGVYSRLANAEKRQAEISSLGLLVSLESSAQQAPTETECHTEEQIAARGL